MIQKRSAATLAISKTARRMVMENSYGLTIATIRDSSKITRCMDM
jgi:hypothetical protein